MKRILGMFMSLAMIISLASFNMKDVSASELSLIDFDFDIYKANLAFKEGNNPINNGVPTYLDVVKRYHDINHPSGVLIDDLDKDAQFAVKIKAFSALTFEPSETLSTALEESEYDFAILLSMLNISTTNDDIIKAMNSKYEKAAKTSEGYISRYLKSVYNINVTSSTPLSSIDKTKMEDAVTNLMKNKYNMVDGIDKGVKLADQYYSSLKDVESIINKITQYICIYMMEEETFSVLEHMYRKTSDSNLQYALNKIITCKDNILATVDNAIKDCNEVVFKAIFKKVVGDMWSGIIKGSPAEVLYIAQKTAKQLCNVCFSTDQISEQYYKMKELCEIENLLVTASADIGNEYLSNKTSFNAKAYNNSVDLYFNLCGVSADYAIEFADIIYNKSSAAIFLDKNNYDDFVKTVNSIKTTYETIKEDLNTDYLFYLEEDYPSIYKEYNNMVLEGENGGINTSGKCGDNVTWTLYNNGHLYISGTGKMKNYAFFNDVPWYSYSKNDIKNVTIEQGVTSIGEFAFYDCTNLTTITIPNSVTSIGGYAFDGCKSLTSITIPNSVTSIGWRAFSGCTSLTSVTIPNSITSIGYSAFGWCTSLKSITIPSSVTSIGAGAFAGCNLLTNINVDSANANYCSTDGVLYNKSKSILIACPGKKSISVPNSVTSIGEEAFYSNKNLTNVTIPDSITSIGEEAFGWCSMNSIEIPSSVTSIKQEAFRYCTNLTSITIPESIRSIEQGVFYKCTNLTNVTIPNSVTRIEDFAFGYCKSLVNITIPNSVTSIGGSAFEDCTSLKSITIPNSVTSIGKLAFWECTSLISITIPNSVTSIGEGAFEDCTSLTSITIPKRVTSIGREAFSGCTSLISITIPKSVTIINSLAFKDCPNVTLYVYPDSYALKYAKSNNLKYELISSDVGVEKIELDHTDERIKKGESLQLNVTYTPNDATNKTVTWTSNNSNVATVDENGLVKAVGYGNATITATTANGKEATCKVNVYAAIDDCNVSEIQSQTYTGKALQPVVTVKDGDKILSEGIDYTVTYEDNVNVGTASVTITGKGNYTGTITKTFKINPKKVNPTSIKLNATSKTIQKGKTYTLTTTVTPTNATDKTVTYTTSNSKVATVTSTGTVTAVNGGIATITVTTSNGLTATCKVTVPYTVKYNLNGGTNNKSNPTSYYGKKITLQNPTRKGYVFAGWYSDSKYKTKVTSFSSGNKTLYAKWNKVSVGKTKTPTLTNIETRKLKVSYTAISGVKGYQIQYGTNSKFTGSKTKYVTSRSYTLTSLTKGKRYYVRVRGYKLDSTGNKVYGSWSSAKNIKISK